MGSIKLFIFLQGVFFVAQVRSRAVNISTTWSLPQEAFPHFFRYFKHPATWEDAKKVCESFQGGLLTVETEERRDAARAYLKELDVLEKVWIGLQRSNAESPFVWTGGGENNEQLADDGFWQEPPPLEPPTLCVAVNPLYDFRWQTLSCTDPEILPFICQLPVPSWAKDCLVSSLPSLTVTYLLEHRVIELLSDCGLSGTKRIACRGKENQADLIKRLSCDHDEEIKNSTTPWAGSSRIHHWDTSTPADWTNSITSQITHSSGTRHKRESKGTSAGTDSSLLSTSDSSWNQDPVYNKTEGRPYQEEARNIPDVTTVYSEEANEDQIEESKRESIAPQSNLPALIIESENHQSDVIVATDAAPPIVTTNDSLIKIDLTVIENKLDESEITENGSTTEVLEIEELENGDPNIIPVIALEAQESQNYQNTPIIEIDKQNAEATPGIDLLHNSKVEENIHGPSNIDLIAYLGGLTTAGPGELKTRITPEDSSVSKAIGNPPTTEGGQSTIIHSSVSTATHELLNNPSTNTPDSEAEDLLLDTKTSTIELVHVDGPFFQQENMEGEIEKVEPKITDEPDEQTEINPDEQTILLIPDRNAATLQKYQVSSSSTNQLKNENEKDPFKETKTTFNYPSQLQTNNSVSNPAPDNLQQGENPIKEITEVNDIALPSDIPLIIIAEMVEVDGKEMDDVEQVHPFTAYESGVVFTETNGYPSVSSSTVGKEEVILNATDSSQMEEGRTLESETEASMLPVNSQYIEAVPETGRPLMFIKKNDSVESTTNETSWSQQIEPSTDVPRSSANNEPKDTVSDSTTHVQTLSTPTQAESLLAEESNDEMETHKRPIRGHHHSHFGALSFYPYFLNRVLG